MEPTRARHICILKANFHNCSYTFLEMSLELCLPSCFLLNIFLCTPFLDGKKSWRQPYPHGILVLFVFSDHASWCVCELEHLVHWHYPDIPWESVRAHILGGSRWLWATLTQLGGLGPVVVETLDSLVFPTVIFIVQKFNSPIVKVVKLFFVIPSLLQSLLSKYALPGVGVLCSLWFPVA